MFESRHAADDYFAHQLGDLGLNLSQPQPVEHLFYFARPDSMEVAAVKLRSEGFIPALSTEPVDGSWSLVAKGQMVLSAESMSKSRDRMEQLAAECGGNYDGWGIPFGKGIE